MMARLSLCALLALFLFVAPAVEAEASGPVRNSAAPPSPSFPTDSPSFPADSLSFPAPTGNLTTPAWPSVRGPFSWADRVMNSTTIARSGGLYRLRQQTLDLYTPTLTIRSFPAFQAWSHTLPRSTTKSLRDFNIARQGRLPSTENPARSSPSVSAPTGNLPLDFFSYALGARLYEDAATLLFADGLFAPSDTLTYLRGLVAYDVHDFALAAENFSAVPEGSPYRSQAQSFIDTYTSLPEIPGYRDKSPLLAAAMSALIPGSGKIYAGDLRSGVSTLLIVGALGGMVAESWVKLGLGDWRTITLSSVFGLFYIGNIYGSALSVSVIKNTYEDAQKATLLFNLRIPLHQL